MSSVADQTQRDDIAQLLDRTLFVEAGAGTGKTTSLVQRVVELIRSGVPIDDLAVITFTEKAAAELRDRVRAALDSPTAGELEHIALAGLDGAAISTLHGFAQRILSENPLEAQLPPVIEVHSEIGTQVEFERRWRHFLDELLDDPANSQLVQRAVSCGIELRQLKALARILDDEWDRLPPERPARVALSPIDLTPVTEPVRRAISLSSHCTDADDKLCQLLAGLGSWLATADAAQASSSDPARLRVLVPDPKLKSSRRGAKPNWPPDVLDEVRGLLDDADGELRAIVGRVIDEALRQLLGELGRFTLAGVEERRSSGRLHFHDLLVMARDLLRRSPEIRLRLHKHYRHLLIDEFQDTDPIQIEIARLIATSDPLAHTQAWTDITTEPGRLFFVGDAKQAIYRFRRADISLFLAVRDSAESDERVLSTNFRTVPGIVEWVNRCFVEIMGEGVPAAQPAYNALVPHRSPHSSGTRPVAVVGGPLDARRAPERRAAMSDDLAASLRQVMVESWQVHDRRTGQWRDPKWADIAVLIPARTGLPEMRAAFDRAGVPYRIEASSLVWLTQEVRELLAVLRAIDDPTDELALVAALRSPAFACGDDDLARFVSEGGRLELGRTVPEQLPATDPVVAGIASLQELHRDAVWDEPSALVERVIRERHLMEIATGSTRPRDVWRRLRFVADQARAYADAEGGMLRDFLEWTDLQADESARVSETILPETDDDAVRVMTIHASKGLEFPIVAVAGLDRRPVEPRYVPTILWHPDGRPEAHLKKPLSTAGYEALKASDTEHEGYEAWRLMYVGTTRARDHLIVCVHHHEKATPANNVAARFHQLCADNPDLWRQLDITAVPGPPATVAEPTSRSGSRSSPDPETIRSQNQWEQQELGLAAVGERRPSRDEWIARRTELLAETARPAVVAATAVARLAPDEPAEESHEPWRRGRAGTSIGRAVHATMQTVDLATGQGLAAIAAAQAAAEGIPDRAAEVERSARAALGAPSVQAAARQQHWRELYVGAPLGGVVCEGYLDLLVDGPDGLEIIDYKTDRAPDPTALIERYRLQTATYALLVEATLGRPVTRCLLVVLGPAGADEVEITELAAAKDEVVRLLAEQGRPLTAVTLERQEFLRGMSEDYRRLQDDPERWAAYLAEREDWDAIG